MTSPAEETRAGDLTVLLFGTGVFVGLGAGWVLWELTTNPTPVFQGLVVVGLVLMVFGMLIAAFQAALS